jgi:hypothetical protein
MRQIKESMICMHSHRTALHARGPLPRLFAGLISIMVINPEVRSHPTLGREGMMNISDVVLQCSRRSLRLAADCTDEQLP